MRMRVVRGCLRPAPVRLDLGEFEWDRCPKRAVLDNPWIGAVWASTDLVTLKHSNLAHDAIGIAKSAESWRHRKDYEAREQEMKAKKAHAKATR